MRLLVEAVQDASRTSAGEDEGTPQDALLSCKNPQEKGPMACQIGFCSLQLNPKPYTLYPVTSPRNKGSMPLSSKQHHPTPFAAIDQQTPSRQQENLQLHSDLISKHMTFTGR